MDAPAPASALYADAPLLRLTWLVQLRWVALGVAVLGLLIATALHLPFVAPRPIIAAIAVGALYNTWFLFRLRRLQCAPTEPPEGAFHRELELQAIADVGALTLLLLPGEGPPARWSVTLPLLAALAAGLLLLGGAP